MRSQSDSTIFGVTTARYRLKPAFTRLKSFSCFYKSNAFCTTRYNYIHRLGTAKQELLERYCNCRKKSNKFFLANTKTHVHGVYKFYLPIILDKLPIEKS